MFACISEYLMRAAPARTEEGKDSPEMKLKDLRL